MFSAFFTGFFLGMSLIVAIGAQNAFVLRQGIIRRHVFYVALFCAIADSLLIIIGVTGISIFLNSFVSEFSNVLYGISAAWLFGYGIIRLKFALIGNSSLEITKPDSINLKSTLLTLSILTFANPHVYLDTVLLIGSISQQFTNESKVAYTLGACVSSFVFFFSISYGSKILSPLMKSQYSWQILDCIIALIMFTIAWSLIVSGNLYKF
ncbi:LysE family transporter [Candidatus Pseudothioglobus singularis]|jgi:L-lysine exporter family protein LysE/ArgO|nr:LysE family transporter [Candidatus Pseudothioglobus singularis]